MLEIGIVAFAVVVGWRACCVQIASMRQHDNIFFSTSPWFRPHVRGVGDAVVNSQGSGGQEPSPGRDSPRPSDALHALILKTIHISPAALSPTRPTNRRLRTRILCLSTCQNHVKQLRDMWFAREPRRA
jgi:hypothetical protein